MVNTGQSCIGPKRLIVDDSRKQELETKLVEGIKSSCAFGKNYSVLVHEQAKQDVKKQVEAAVSGGATLLLGEADGGSIKDVLLKIFEFTKTSW